MMLFCLVTWLLFFHSPIVNAQFGDVRCKCVCPSNTHGKPEVVVENVPPEECKCGLITKKNETDCLKCECEFQSRSTLTMKIAVIFVISLIMLLSAYMVVLHVLDRSGSGYQPISVQEEDQAGYLSSQTSRMSDQSTGHGWRARITSAHRRWNHRVQRQREVIFETQTILS